MRDKAWYSFCASLYSEEHSKTPKKKSDLSTKFSQTSLIYLLVASHSKCHSFVSRINRNRERTPANLEKGLLFDIIIHFIIMACSFLSCYSSSNQETTFSKNFEKSYWPDERLLDFVKERFWSLIFGIKSDALVFE